MSVEVFTDNRGRVKLSTTPQCQPITDQKELERARIRFQTPCIGSISQRSLYC